MLSNVVPSSTARQLAHVGLRGLGGLWLLALTASPPVGAQTWIDRYREVETQKAHLTTVLPDAERYEFVSAALPHFRAYQGSRLIGLAFFTNELDPRINGSGTSPRDPALVAGIA